MPSFPDTWTYVDHKIAGGTLQIVLPACHGSVRRVVTDISVKVVNEALGGGIWTAGVVLLDGATFIGASALRILLLDLSIVSTDSADISGPFSGSPATSLTASLDNFFPGNVEGTLSITGYDL